MNKEKNNIRIFHISISNTGIKVVSLNTHPVLKIIASDKERDKHDIRSEVLAASRSLEMLGILTLLKTLNEVRGVDSRKNGIFTGSLLATTPTRITNDVDVRSPEGQTSIAIVVEDVSFTGNGLSDAVEKSSIEGTSSGRNLREGGSVTKE